MTAKEFQIPRETLRRRLGESHQGLAADGTFGTGQICEALFCDMHKEKIRTQRALSLASS
jgi:hypothetical protein